MSILRTSKFVRYIGTLARNIVLNNSRSVDGLLIKRHNHVTLYSRNYSAVAAAATTQHHCENSIDKSIRRLDEDARRMGRISRRELEEVIEELKSTRSATSSQSLMLIRCCGNLVPEESLEFRTELVKSVWQILEKLGVPLDISHYNALIRVYLENEHKFSPTEILSELEKKGIEPNRVTYQRLMAGYCQRGDINGATQILEFMREKQMPISEGVFNALILGHSKAGDLESARGILNVMGQASLEPSSDTYGALLCGYASVGDVESLQAIFEECEKKEIHLTDRDYLEIAFTLAINNHDNLVDLVLKKIHRSGGYNQDACNVILRLVNHGKEAVAFKILETMAPPLKADGQMAPIGGFLIRQLVKANRPLESILNICDQLKENGLNSRGLLIATEIALQSGSTDLSLDLLKAMRDNFYPIRNHYFWPLIVKKGEQNAQGVLEILKSMTEFKVTPNYETLRDYVLPYIAPNDLKNVSNLISELQSCGISVGATAAALVGYFLTKGDIKLAADIATTFKANYMMTVPQRLLVTAFLNTNDIDSFTTLISALVQGKNMQREEGELQGFDDREYVGRILLNVIGAKRSFNLIDFLQKMLDMGIGISNSTAEQIQSQLSGTELTAEVSMLLSQLVSGDLEPVRLKQQQMLRFAPKNEESLRNFIVKLKAKGDPALNIKRQLFNLLCTNKDLNKVLDYKKELEDEGYVFTTGMRAMLIELYLFHDNLESALEEYEILLKQQPDIKLDSAKTIKLATGLVQADRFNDALEFLKMQARDENDINKEKEKDKPFIYSSLCWRLLNTLAEKGDTNGVRKVFDCLIENKFIEPNNALLGPLVKAHLVKDDLTGALEVFEWCCQHYRATPFKNELACRLIQKEDANELQRLTDLSTTVHGEINSLHDLILAFVECGRIRQARKILETPGLRVRTDRLSYAGERYQNEGLVEPLETLVKATKDIPQIDRASLFYQLLLLYKKADDVEKAVGLWTQMQEEDVQPSDEFLHELGLFLKSKNEPVPFVIPEIVEKSSIPENIPTTDEHRKLQLAIIDKNWPRALKEFTALRKSNGKLYPKDVAGFLELAMNSVDVIEVLKFVKEMLTNGILIPRYKLYYFAKTLAKTGNLKAFEDFGNFLNDDQKMKLKYQNLKCNCYIVGGNTDELLSVLEEKIKNATSTGQLEIINQDFPYGGLLAVLNTDSNLLPRVENIVEKLASQGLLTSANVLWMYYIKTDNEKKAEEIFTKYLKSSPKLFFRYVQSEARSSQDETKIDKLLSFLKNWDNVNSKQFGIAHSAKIDILVGKNEPEKALAYLKEVLKEISLEDCNRTALIRLKSSLAAKNIEFPYSVDRLKNQRSPVDEESSDSDVEEASRKRAPLT